MKTSHHLKTCFPILLTLLFLIQCTFGARAQQNLNKSRELSNYFEGVLSDDPEQPVVNILCYLEEGKSGFVFHEGFGTISREHLIPVSKSQTFKIASITKMFTAVVIMQLYEENRLDPDRPVYEYLKNMDFIRFDSLHIYDGTSWGKQITVQQLLRHRSGLADIFIDAEEDFNEYVFQHPRTQWNPEKLFDMYFAFEVNKKTKSEPGEAFAYTDVGYFLLGLCIEEITGDDLAAQYRKRILEPLGMKHTYFEYYEDPVDSIPQAHAFLGSTDATAAINTSFDWAGGGLVSNTRDLAIFIRGLFNHRLFENKSTLQMMIDKDRYGYGTGVFHFDEKTWYGHVGYWGSGLYFCPEDELTICVSINQVNPPFDFQKMVEKASRLMIY